MLLETLTVLLTLSLGSGLRLGVKEPDTTGKDFPEQFLDQTLDHFDATNPRYIDIMGFLPLNNI